jgi:spore coat polysaccharide biosynthesis protein SpsF
MIAIIQARMSSRRLPGKSMMKIQGKTILQRVIERVNCSVKVKKIIVATSRHKSDCIIKKFCEKKNIEHFQGDLVNVYKRFVDLVKKKNIKKFVRICADSPFIDPKIIDKLIVEFNKNNFDLVTNVYPRSFPKGQSVEVIKAETFIKNFKKIKNKSFLEHITKYFYSKKNSKKIRIKNIKNIKNFSNYNLSIDTLKDFKNAQLFLKKKIYSKKDSWQKILANYQKS